MPESGGRYALRRRRADVIENHVIASAGPQLTRADALTREKSGESRAASGLGHRPGRYDTFGTLAAGAAEISVSNSWFFFCLDSRKQNAGCQLDKGRDVGARSAR